ncbi:MAG: tRNA glutamyl-Q(34) synthetase GluQRS [Desulfuromonadales bacterium]|nr:tRNA glutamyl-Q(34) synthetase GluQRS [Desulfuromonadales bacterium]
MSNPSFAEALAPQPLPVGRFAPSPTGPLHFGSLLAALGSYLSIRRRGGIWRLRIEDLDPLRTIPGSEDELLRTLESLGLEWDGPLLRQSERFAVYEAALQELAAQGLLFRCSCSRKEILATAPHAGEEGPIYPGTCRQGLRAGQEARALRLRVDNKIISFVDKLYGPYQQNLSLDVGDFVLKRADGLFGYQLAVVVDDGASGITEVVRGADLLASTPRQIYLQRLLGLPTPAYLHLPLALGDDGEKLSKRHGRYALPADPGRALFSALIFLGQRPPPELRGAPPAELLAWAVTNFNVAAINKENRLSPEVDTTA